MTFDLVSMANLDLSMYREHFTGLPPILTCFSYNYKYIYICVVLSFSHVCFVPRLECQRSSVNILCQERSLFLCMRLHTKPDYVQLSPPIKGYGSLSPGVRDQKSLSQDSEARYYFPWAQRLGVTQRSPTGLVFFSQPTQTRSQTPKVGG